MKYVLCLLAMTMFGAAPLFAQDESDCPKIVIDEVQEVKVEITDADVDAVIEAIKSGSLDDLIKECETLGLPDEITQGLKKLKDADVSDKAAIKKLLEEIGLKFAGEEMKCVEGAEDSKEVEEVVKTAESQLSIGLEDGTTLTFQLDEKGNIKKEDLDKLTAEQRKQVEDAIAALKQLGDTPTEGCKSSTKVTATGTATRSTGSGTSSKTENKGAKSAGENRAKNVKEKESDVKQ